MARRVLGDDPFEPPKSDAPEAAKTPAKGTRRVSARPRKSEAPKAPRRSKAPPRDSVAPEVADVAVPPPPPLPRLDADDLPAPVSSRPSLAPEEAVAEADVPPAFAPDADASAAAAAPAAEPPTAPVGDDVEASIRELEARLDQLLASARDADRARPMLDRMADRLRAATAPAKPAEAAATDDAAADDARELLSSEYYLRQWGRVAMRDRSEEVDEFGYDPEAEARWKPLFEFLYERWWRVDVSGIERVPATGRVALVCNHSGAVPYDGIMLSMALRRDAPTPRQLRWLAEDFIFHLPFAGAFLTRLGAVRACQENAERLLRHDACVAMFPEGVKGIAKLYRDRYRLQRFGRGGHIKLCLRTRTPIVPVAIVGAEETHPLVAPSAPIARMLSLPYFPITPTFPLLGAAGLVPLPSKWHIVFGDPMPMDGYSPDAADDEVLVNRLNEKLRATIQDMLERALRARRSVFSG